MNNEELIQFLKILVVLEFACFMGAMYLVYLSIKENKDLNKKLNKK